MVFGKGLWDLVLPSFGVMLVYLLMSEYRFDGYSDDPWLCNVCIDSWLVTLGFAMIFLMFSLCMVAYSEFRLRVFVLVALVV